MMYPNTMGSFDTLQGLAGPADPRFTPQAVPGGAAPRAPGMRISQGGSSPVRQTQVVESSNSVVKSPLVGVGKSLAWAAEFAKDPGPEPEYPANHEAFASQSAWAKSKGLPADALSFGKPGAQELGMQYVAEKKVHDAKLAAWMAWKAKWDQFAAFYVGAPPEKPSADMTYAQWIAAKFGTAEKAPLFAEQEYKTWVAANEQKKAVYNQWIANVEAARAQVKQTMADAKAVKQAKKDAQIVAEIGVALGRRDANALARLYEQQGMSSEQAKQLAQFAISASAAGGLPAGTKQPERAGFGAQADLSRAMSQEQALRLGKLARGASRAGGDATPENLEAAIQLAMQSRDVDKLASLYEKQGMSSEQAKQLAQFAISSKGQIPTGVVKPPRADTVGPEPERPYGSRRGGPAGKETEDLELSIQMAIQTKDFDELVRLYKKKGSTEARAKETAYFLIYGKKMGGPPRPVGVVGDGGTPSGEKKDEKKDEQPPVTPPKTDQPPPKSPPGPGGGGGGGGGGFDPGFYPPSQEPPETPPVQPVQPVEKKSSAFPLLALGALAYFLSR
jgi:hypothetical protein